MSGADVDRQPLVSGLCNVIESLLESRVISEEFRDFLFASPFEQALQARIGSLGLSAMLAHPSYHLNARNRASAASGNPKSLGACVLCLVAWEDEGTLGLIFGQHPHFVEDIGELLEYRGHGNECLLLEQSDVQTIRDKSFLLIKTLLETLPCH